MLQGFPAKGVLSPGSPVHTTFPPAKSRGSQSSSMPCTVPCPEHLFSGASIYLHKTLCFLLRCHFCQWIFSTGCCFFFSLLNMSSLYFGWSSVFFCPSLKQLFIFQFWIMRIWAYFISSPYMLLEGRKRVRFCHSCSILYVADASCLDWLWDSLQHWTEWLHNILTYHDLNMIGQKVVQW